MSDPEPTVFLVDDDQAVLTALERSLGERGFQIETFSSAEEFLKDYDTERPGCLVLDQGMPNMSGLELQDLLVRTGIQLPIIFITGHGDVPQSAQAFRAGAIDFLQKPFRQNVLVERILEAFSIDAGIREARALAKTTEDSFDKLTDREREIAMKIVSSPSNSSSKEIARALSISHRTVEHHKARILEKLGLRSIMELVELSAKSKLPRE